MRVTPMTPILLTNWGMVKKPEKWNHEEANSKKLEGISEPIKQNIVNKQLKQSWNPYCFELCLHGVMRGTLQIAILLPKKEK